MKNIYVLHTEVLIFNFLFTVHSHNGSYVKDEQLVSDLHGLIIGFIYLYFGFDFKGYSLSVHNDPNFI